MGELPAGAQTFAQVGKADEVSAGDRQRGRPRGEKDEARLAALRPDERPVAWAFRFLQGIPEVTVTLSGMSDFEQLKENVQTYSEERPLSEEELAALMDIAHEMGAQGTVPCTACHYCTSHCPMGLDIPHLLSLYNQLVVTGKGDFIAPMALSALPEDKRPSACIGCGSCAAVCPQQIDIPGTLADFASRLAG